MKENIHRVEGYETSPVGKGGGDEDGQDFGGVLFVLGGFLLLGGGDAVQEVLNQGLVRAEFVAYGRGTGEVFEEGESVVYPLAVGLVGFV